MEWDGFITFMDLDRNHSPDVVGDFRAIPFKDSTFGVLVFDPPHLPRAAASRAAMDQMVDSYGLNLSSKRDSISEYFQGFLREALRVLQPEGVIFAKLKDYIHNHQYQWVLTDWINSVKEVEGLTACDLRIKVDPAGGNLKSGRWKAVHHARNAHCWWVVVRKGRCEPKMG